MAVFFFFLSSGRGHIPEKDLPSFIFFQGEGSAQKRPLAVPSAWFPTEGRDDGTRAEQRPDAGRDDCVLFWVLPEPISASWSETKLFLLSYGNRLKEPRAYQCQSPIRRPGAFHIPGLQ